MKIRRAAQPLRAIIEATAKEWKWLSSESRPGKILFDHLPKCGGTTLKTYLAAQYPRRKIFNISGTDPQIAIETFRSFPHSKQHGYHLIMGHLATELRALVDPVCLQCTLLRDPVDRFVSIYYYIRRVPHHYLNDDLMKVGMTLETFARSEISGDARNWITVHFSGMKRENAEENPQEAVARALAMYNQFDIVGFVDHYPTFVNTLRASANLSLEYRDEKLNVGANRPPLSEIPLKTRQIIEEANFLDVEFYARAYALFCQAA